MSQSGGQWQDLSLRLASGLVMAVIGMAALWAGGIFWLGLVLLIVAVIVWEAARMLAPETSQAKLVQIAGAAAIGVGLAVHLPPIYFLPVLAASVMVGLSLIATNKPLFAGLTVVILLAAVGLYVQLALFGLVWVAWLIGVVAITDIAGYFAGRAFGGPKFWPAISPKKTWSGTIAGWLGAAAFGVVFWVQTPAGFDVVLYSIILSFASQMGDIAESWIKRSTGVKDSSALIPGHGGVWDRFDGMLGAALVLLLIEQVTDFPPVTAVV